MQRQALDNVREDEAKHVIDFLRREEPILLVDVLERDAKLVAEYRQPPAACQVQIE